MKIRHHQKPSPLHQSKHTTATTNNQAFADQLNGIISDNPPNAGHPEAGTPHKDPDHANISGELHQIADALENIASHKQGPESLNNIAQSIADIHSQHPLVQDAKTLIATEIERLKQQIY